MTFQGHIHNGTVVFDEVVSLPEGSIVRVESVTMSKEQSESNRPVHVDTDQPRTVEEMARAWKGIGRPIEEGVALSVDPDDYPLF